MEFIFTHLFLHQAQVIVTGPRSEHCVGTSTENSQYWITLLLVILKDSWKSFFKMAGF
jgi:hypothetical protein